jgi:hypothetical protein
MKLVGLLITIFLVSLLFVWWINLSLKSTQRAWQTTQTINKTQETEDVQQGTNPVEYSKQKVDEINQDYQNQADEFDQL